MRSHDHSEYAFRVWHAKPIKPIALVQAITIVTSRTKNLTKEISVRSVSPTSCQEHDRTIAVLNCLCPKCAYIDRSMKWAAISKLLGTRRRFLAVMQPHIEYVQLARYFLEANYCKRGARSTFHFIYIIHTGTLGMCSACDRQARWTRRERKYPPRVAALVVTTGKLFPWSDTNKGDWKT